MHVVSLTYIYRGEQQRILQEFPGEPREQRHTSSEPRGSPERGTQDRRRLEGGGGDQFILCDTFKVRISEAVILDL